MSPRRLKFFLSFFSGVALATGAHWAAPVAFYFLFLALALYLIIRRRPAERRVYLSLTALVSFGLSFGLSVGFFLSAADDLHFALNQSVTLTGLVAAEPDARERGTNLVFVPDNHESAILLKVARYPEYRYGERLQVSGKVEVPENFETEAGREFDYINYLAKDQIYYLIAQPQIQSLGQSTELLVRARGVLISFKQAFVRSIASVLPEPHSALLAGIAIGAKSGFPSLWQERFRTAGLSHMIVLSGYNITIVAEAVSKALAFLPPLAGYLAGGLSVVLFTLATGASSTAVRAAIMASVALAGRATGRAYHSLDALLLAALVMILFEPKILLYDPSFQLSFLATIGVIVGPPLLKERWQFIPERFGFREMLVTTVSAQAIVLPWILYKMGNLSLVALPTNLLVLALVPLTMFLGSLAAVLGFASYWLAFPAAYLSYWLLQYFLTVVRVAAAIPYAAVNISYFPWWFAASVYIFYGWLYHRLNKKDPVTTSDGVCGGSCRAG